MKIFISGVESFVGKNLVSYCLKNSIDYFGIDLNCKDSKNTKCMDINSTEIFKYIDPDSIVVHLAAISTDKDCKKDLNLSVKTNINGTLNLFHNSIQARCKKFIFASSEWVYGDINSKEMINEDYRIDLNKLNSIYAITKFTAENLLRNISSDIEVIILRLGIIFSDRIDGNISVLEKLFSEVKQKKIITVESKKFARRFIHIDDIISGILSACRSKEVFNYEIFNLSGKDLITLDQIIKYSAVLFNKDINIVENSSNKTTSRNVDNSKAKYKLNWSPKISFKDGMNILFNKFK